jgi:hypothetical protein
MALLLSALNDQADVLAFGVQFPQPFSLISDMSFGTSPVSSQTVFCVFSAKNDVNQLAFNQECLGWKEHV